LEHFDEQPANDLALGFGVGNAFQLTNETIHRINVDEMQIVVLAEHGNDIRRLVLAHQTVVNKNTGELFANSLVDQQCGDRRVDAAGQRANHTTSADLLADFFNRTRTIGRHRPVTGNASNLADEVRQQLGAIGRVHDFRMEHRRIVTAALISSDGEWCILRYADDLEAFRCLRDAVAVAHPHRIFLANFPDTLEQRAFLEDLDLCTPELTTVSALDLATQLGGKNLLSVTDRKNREARVDH